MPEKRVAMKRHLAAIRRVDTLGSVGNYRVKQGGRPDEAIISSTLRSCEGMPPNAPLSATWLPTRPSARFSIGLPGIWTSWRMKLSGQ